MSIGEVITWFCQRCDREVTQAHWHRGKPYCGACFKLVAKQWLLNRV